MIRNSDSESESTIGITNRIAKQLRKSQPWIYFLVGIGVISSLLSLLSIISLFKYSVILATSRLVATILQLIIAFFLFKYARSIDSILASGSAKDLGVGLSVLNKVWILMSIEVGFSVLLVVIHYITRLF